MSARVDQFPDRCTASVHNGSYTVSFHRCLHKAVKDGFCKQHHPGEEKKRRDARDAEWQLRHKASTLRYAIENALQDIAFATRDAFDQGASLPPAVLRACRKLKALSPKKEK